MVIPKNAAGLHNSPRYSSPCSEDGVPLSDGADVDGVSVGALLNSIAHPYSAIEHFWLVTFDGVARTGGPASHVDSTGEVVSSA